MIIRSVRIVYNLTLNPDKDFIRRVSKISGFIPLRPQVYQLAFRHSSLVSNQRRSVRECNERLEYLGDAILGAVISDFLYEKYPNRDEGYLTEMRSRIVNRKSLNTIGLRLGLDKLLKYNKRHNGFHHSMVGNSLEAFIGAIYQDRGYPAARRFILERILQEHINLEEVSRRNTNFKSQLMEFVQKHKLDDIRYELVDEKTKNDRKVFKVAVIIGNDVLGYGLGTRKKLAEQQASAEALVRLNVLENEVLERMPSVLVS